MTVDFKSTALEPLVFQTRVVQSLFDKWNKIEGSDWLDQRRELGDFRQLFLVGYESGILVHVCVLAFLPL